MLVHLKDNLAKSLMGHDVQTSAQDNEDLIVYFALCINPAIEVVMKRLLLVYCVVYFC